MIYTHAACLQHCPGPGHPESPDRLKAVLRALDAPVFAAIPRVEAPQVERALIDSVHPGVEYAQIFAHAPRVQTLRLDSDTVMHPATESLEAALRGAGAVVAAVDAVLDGHTRRAFCAVRPPGHHATPDRAMGFCIFNNVAVAAAHALKKYGLQRVAIADFDVHHGNGTEHIFRDDPCVMLCSTFQHPFYPYAGADSGNAHIVNVPLPAGTGGAEFRDAVTQHWLPALEAFAPEFLLISAGFDAHRDDDMAMMSLVERDYAWVTGELMQVAARHAGGRIVSVLEGGYELNALGRSAAAHIKTMASL